MELPTFMDIYDNAMAERTTDDKYIDTIKFKVQHVCRKMLH